MRSPPNSRAQVVTSEREDPRRGAFAGDKKHKPRTTSLQAVFAGLLAWLASTFLQLLAPSSFGAFSPAFAAGREKDKEKDKGAGAGNASAPENGTNKAKDTDEGHNGVDNGIAQGNGIAVGLGEGVGLGIGVRNGDSIGVGIGISVDQGDKYRSLASFDRDKGRSRSGKSERDDWRRTDNGNGHKYEDGKLDLGKQFDVDRIKKGLGPDLDELGKLLIIEAPQDRMTGTGGGALVNAPAFAQKPDPVNVKGDLEAGQPVRGEKTMKADAGGEGEAEKAAREAAKAAREAGREDGKAAGKAETVEAPTAASSSLAADKRSVAGDRTVSVAPGSYVGHEVFGVGLNPRSISRARQLGFSINETGQEHEQGALLTLHAPTGLDSLQAIALLRRELPHDAFHLNRIYRPNNTAQDDLDDTQTPPD
jgi:hypothetical protein